MTEGSVEGSVRKHDLVLTRGDRPEVGRRKEQLKQSARLAYVKLNVISKRKRNVVKQPYGGFVNARRLIRLTKLTRIRKLVC